MGLVQLFKSRNDLSRNLVWRLIKLEQEKILSKVCAMPVGCYVESKNDCL